MASNNKLFLLNSADSVSINYTEVGIVITFTGLKISDSNGNVSLPIIQSICVPPGWFCFFSLTKSYEVIKQENLNTYVPAMAKITSKDTSIAYSSYFSPSESFCDKCFINIMSYPLKSMEIVNSNDIICINYGTIHYFSPSLFDQTSKKSTSLSEWANTNNYIYNDTSIHASSNNDTSTANSSTKKNNYDNGLGIWTGLKRVAYVDLGTEGTINNDLRPKVGLGKMNDYQVTLSGTNGVKIYTDDSTNHSVELLAYDSSSHVSTIPGRLKIGNTLMTYDASYNGLEVYRDYGLGNLKVTGDINANTMSVKKHIVIGSSVNISYDDYFNRVDVSGNFKFYNSVEAVKDISVHNLNAYSITTSDLTSTSSIYSYLMNVSTFVTAPTFSSGFSIGSSKITSFYVSNNILYFTINGTVYSVSVAKH